MTSQEFLNYIWKEIESKFPTSCIEYEFDHISQTHFIKLTPQVIYDSNSFMELESSFHDMWAEVEKGFEEDLSFLSCESLIQLSSPTLIYSPDPKEIQLLIPEFDHYEKVEINVIDNDYYSYVDSTSIIESSENIKFAMAA